MTLCIIALRFLYDINVCPLMLIFLCVIPINATLFLSLSPPLFLSLSQANLHFSLYSLFLSL